MRQRTLKPGFFKNEYLAEMTPFERLLFAGLILVSDRAGRFEDRPVRLRAEIFPYEADLDVDAMLCRLEHRGFIRRYEVQGTRYGLIPTFDNHQHPHPKEPASVIPAPAESRGDAVKSNGEDVNGNFSTMSRPSIPSGSSIPSGPSGSSESGARAHAEPPLPIPPGARGDDEIDQANAIHAEIRGGPCPFVHDLIPVFRAYPDTWADGWRRFLESKRGKPRASPREFAGNAKHWCEPQGDAVAEFLAQGMVLGRSA